MNRTVFALIALVAPMVTQADTVNDIVDAHILPKFDALAEHTQSLSDVAANDCSRTSVDLRSAYGVAFDAWISASHLRFGPTETDDRAFALAFWPDSRGATPRALTHLLSDQDPIAASLEDYTQVSIAARGFYALEFLLYDDDLMTNGRQSYQCQLIQTISADIAATSQNILDDWRQNYASTMQNPTSTGPYRNEKEVLQEMFKSLATGLQFTAESRLGRPLGTFERSRPNRAEARRSGRSSRHVRLSLLALHDLARFLAQGNPEVSRKLGARFDRALSQVSALNDPTFASVANPQTRIKVEVVQQSVDAIRALVRDELGPILGVAAGFNALDGD